jgi:hypothetical protein
MKIASAITIISLVISSQLATAQANKKDTQKVKSDVSGTLDTSKGKVRRARGSFGNFVDKTQTPGYIPHETFDPTFMYEPGEPYRSGSGAPGPMYWQNRADYKIAATLDTNAKSITGTVEITYTNNSPDELNYLWLQLDQNLFSTSSRGHFKTPIGGGRFGNVEFSGGDSITSVSIVKNGAKGPETTTVTDYVITDTRMQIRLKTPMKAKGDKITIKIAYSFKIPPDGSDRMGMTETQKGRIYEIAQWYPRMCVYDEVEGWNIEPYLGAAEFYLEYGDIDFSVTVPSNMIVAGSGELQNPTEVLTPTEIDRLNKAKASDAKVAIVGVDEIGKPSTHLKSSGNSTWHYKISNTRDASWACSTAFIWDAARINLPTGKKCMSMSFYPIECKDDSSWGRSTEYVKASIEFYSKTYYVFPWPCASNVAGNVHGMEYPGIVFCGWKSKMSQLFFVTTHEFGHNWFPMLVGSNERKYAWMDEGFNTFINIYSGQNFNKGEYNKPQTPDQLIGFSKRDSNVVMTYEDCMPQRDIGMLCYFKPGEALYLLREYVVGHDRFDYAFRSYINRWAFKHPTPKDFFRSMNEGTGEDLNWFWKEWIYKSWQLDQSVSDVKYSAGDTVNGTKGAEITIKNNKQMVMPVIIEVKESNGHTGRVTLPAEIWQALGVWKFHYNSTSTITSVTIDPDKVMPDADRSNNTWPATTN